MKTTRLTTSLIVGTPEHDWYYSMNERQRGFAVHQALKMYYQFMNGQITLSPSPPAIVAANPVGPIKPETVPEIDKLALLRCEGLITAQPQAVEVTELAKAVQSAISTPKALLADFY